MRLHPNSETPRSPLHVVLAAMALGAWVVMGTSHSALAAPMAADGAGCTDPKIASRLAEITDTNPEYITIWAKGMQDGSCRGYSAGQEVEVEEETDEMACVRAEDDTACFWVAKRMAPQ